MTAITSLGSDPVHFARLILTSLDIRLMTTRGRALLLFDAPSSAVKRQQGTAALFLAL
ncbi:hypothetical protein [Pseudomonas sp.]|uniref:hypothetical protein n=1 Tax=Pseudomonas sp. TaxID=306 RepID=UPI0027306F4D|nr:hypothetical protein [Pseudomonas sp.]MDP2245558.1 hypothetical protein [Pseudomonas sp.]